MEFLASEKKQYGVIENRSSLTITIIILTGVEFFLLAGVLIHEKISKTSLLASGTILLLIICHWVLVGLGLNQLLKQQKFIIARLLQQKFDWVRESGDDTLSKRFAADLSSGKMQPAWREAVIPLEILNDVFSEVEMKLRSAEDQLIQGKQSYAEKAAVLQDKELLLRQTGDELEETLRKYRELEGRITTIQQSEAQIRSGLEELGAEILTLTDYAGDKTREIMLDQEWISVSDCMNVIPGKMESICNLVQSSEAVGDKAAELTLTGLNAADKMQQDMGAIQERIHVSAENVNEMQKFSEEIERIVHTIDDIADQTNLLALNAAIEAARAEAQSMIIGETLLKNHLLGTAALLADILVIKNGDISNSEMKAMARRARVENISFSNEDGVLVASNQPEADLGFRYPDDENDFWYPLRALIHQKDGKVSFPIMPRTSDNVPYMYVAVSRRDQPGAVQAAACGESVTRFAQNTRGFAVVAEEVRKLAEETLAATKEVRSQIKTIQKVSQSSVQAMMLSSEAVQNGAWQVGEVDKALSRIRTTIDGVNHSLGELSSEADTMTENITEMGKIVDSIGETANRRGEDWGILDRNLQNLESRIKMLQKGLTVFP